MKQIAVVSMLAMLTGCASLTGSKIQPISVQTMADSREVVGAGCTLENDAGKWFVTTPGSVTINKSTGDLAITCLKDKDLVGNATAVSKSNTAVWGNIVAGGLIGYVVDRNTGAGFDYPATIAVAMRKVEAAPAPAPAPMAGGTQ
jgi:hypothetical protein